MVFFSRLQSTDRLHHNLHIPEEHQLISKHYDAPDIHSYQFSSYCFHHRIKTPLMLLPARFFRLRWFLKTGMSQLVFYHRLILLCFFGLHLPRLQWLLPDRQLYDGVRFLDVTIFLFRIVKVWLQEFLSILQSLQKCVQKLLLLLSIHSDGFAFPVQVSAKHLPSP